MGDIHMGHGRGDAVDNAGLSIATMAQRLAGADGLNQEEREHVIRLRLADEKSKLLARIGEIDRLLTVKR